VTIFMPDHANPNIRFVDSESSFPRSTDFQPSSRGHNDDSGVRTEDSGTGSVSLESTSDGEGWGDKDNGTGKGQVGKRTAREEVRDSDHAESSDDDSVVRN
jgi:hypothetical protein